MLSLTLDNHATIRLLAFLLMVLLVACWEIFKPRRLLSLSKILRWTNNWLISALNSVLLALIFPLLAMGLALLAVERNWGLFNLLDVPAGVSIPLFILLFDVTIYWQHRLYHRVPFLWRLHRMHHADPDFDVSTGIRFHPLSIILSMLIKMLVIVLFGPPAIAVLLAEVILNATATRSVQKLRDDKALLCPQCNYLSVGPSFWQGSEPWLRRSSAPRSDCRFDRRPPQAHAFLSLDRVWRAENFGVAMNKSSWFEGLNDLD